MNNLIKTTQYPLLGLDVFDDIFSRFFEEGSRLKECSGFPPVMQKQTETETVFQFALAGYTENELKVSVEGSTLTLRGQKAEEDDNLFASRAFTWTRKDVSSAWDLEKTDVSFKNGLLTLKIPKKESAQPKLLQITNK